MSQLFFKLFYNQIPIYAKPSGDPTIEKTFLGYCRSTKILDKINMSKFLPENINRGNKQYMACMNYIFMEHIETARKIIKEIEKEKKIGFSEVFNLR